MKSSDPASLLNLNDIALPATIGWWPLATGWYVLIGFVLIVIAWFSYRSLKLWIKNRYRRAALSELQLLEDRMHKPGQRDESLRQIPVLLKRTALSVYPRSQVASLTGKDWFQFLNSTVKNPSFTENTSNTLNVVSYSAGELSKVDLNATTALINASRSWLKHHQAITVPKDVMET